MNMTKTILKPFSNSRVRLKIFLNSWTVFYYFLVVIQIASSYEEVPLEPKSKYLRL